MAQAFANIATVEAIKLECIQNEIRFIRRITLYYGVSLRIIRYYD